MDNNCIISATGGISNWNDVVEFMLLGASTTQICTEVMFKGFNIIEKLNAGLEDYLTRHNFESLHSIIGLSLNKINKFESLDKNIPTIANIDQNNCIKCGNCFTSCTDGAYQAIEYADKSDNITYTVNPDKCTGCGLCSIICPVSCIKMKSAVNALIN